MADDTLHWVVLSRWGAAQAALERIEKRLGYAWDDIRSFDNLAPRLVRAINRSNYPVPIPERLLNPVYRNKTSLVDVAARHFSLELLEDIEAHIEACEDIKAIADEDPLTNVEHEIEAETTGQVLVETPFAKHDDPQWGSW